MKKVLKSLLVTAVIIATVMSFFTLNVSAASTTVSFNAKTYKVGQTVKVTVKYTGDNAVYAAEADVSFSASTLRYVSVAGADATVNGNRIKIMDDDCTNATKTVTKCSYVVTFTAIANGTASVSATVISDGGSAIGNGTASIAVSADASLSSLRLSEGNLEPNFSPNTTRYTARVKNNVTKVTLSAATTDSGATYVGAGTFNLEVGDNVHTVSVTAADGKAKKSYTVTVRRLTEEETAEYEKLQRDSDPLLISVDGNDYHLVKDISPDSIPTGFTLEKLTRRETEICYFKDNNGEYNVFYATRDDDTEQKPVLLYSKGEDEYAVLNYIMSGTDMYIAEEPLADVSKSKRYYSTTLDLENSSISAIGFTEKGYEDFYVVYCYFDGLRLYYRYDKFMGTLQREPSFESSIEATPVSNNGTSLISKFNKLKSTAKIIVVLIIFAVLCAIALIVLIVVKISANRKDYYTEDGDTLQTFDLIKETDEQTKNE